MIDAAIIGLGRWGQGIVEAVQGSSARLRFIRGVCKEPDQVTEFARTHDFTLSTEFADALGDPCVQAVVLATPHSLHVDQIIATAATGRPVWCEKPLALTLAQAERAVAACAKAGVVFALGNNKRCFASMQKLKEIVAGGVIGDVVHIEGHFCNDHSTRVAGGWRDDPAEAPAGGLTGAGLHLIDAFINLVGPVSRVDARCFVNKPAPDPRDAVAVLTEFASGATGVIGTVRAGPAYWRVHVFGTKGWAEARDETTLTLARLGAAPETQNLPAVDSLAVLLDAFARSVELGEPFPVPTRQMLDTVAAFEAAVRSVASQLPVAVDRPRPGSALR